jgi:hypothetical protein
VAEDLDAGLADHVTGGFGVAAGVDQVAGRQAEDGAVGEQLVQVGVRVAGGFLCLVLGVDDRGRRSPGLPDDVQAEDDLGRLVEVVPGPRRINGDV